MRGVPSPSEPLPPPPVRAPRRGAQRPLGGLPAPHRALALSLLLGQLTVACVGATEARRSGGRAVDDETTALPWEPGSALLVGRFEQEPEGLSFAWSGSSATLRFRGTGLSVDLKDSGQNRFYALVDGELRPEKIVPGRGVHTVELASQLPDGEHTVTLVRLTEALVGETQLLQIRLPPGAELLPPPAPRERRIELIGDSISAGYGNEGPDATCPFSPSTENHYATYGAIAARELDADLVTIAWSGKGVSSNRGTNDPVLMPELWRRTLPERSESLWSFDGPAPHAVVVNLGTNDFAPEVEDTSPFAEAYYQLLLDVRQRYPEAYLLCTVGPLLSDSWPPGRRALSTVRDALRDAVRRRSEAGDAHVGFLEFAPVSADEGFGCDYHPSLATHRRMATELVGHLRTALGWDVR